MVKVNDLLHTSWGYDMTMNDFCKVLEVSKTGKTVKVRMVVTVTNGGEHYPGSTGKASAGSKMVGPEFRLHVRNYGGDSQYFVGSYPFMADHDSNSKRRGSFSKTEAGCEYYENHVD